MPDSLDAGQGIAPPQDQRRTQTPADLAVPIALLRFFTFASQGYARTASRGTAA